jgi:anti-anti-sigma factor
VTSEYDQAPQRTIRWSGAIDTAATGAFAGEIRSAERSSHAGVAIDLSQVTFIDSSGLRVLMRAHQRRPLELVGVSPQVAGLLELTGLVDFFDPSTAGAG